MSDKPAFKKAKEKARKSQVEVDSVIDPADLKEAIDQATAEQDAAWREMDKADRKLAKQKAKRTEIKARQWSVEITIIEHVGPKGAVRTSTIADGHITHGLEYDLVEERALMLESIQMPLETVVRKHSWSMKGYREQGDMSFLSES